MADHEWEMSKENVAPVRGGRDVQTLNKALKIPKKQLEVQRTIREDEVRQAIAGHGPHKNDPLEAWSRYTKWVIENYPAGSDILIRAIEEVCRLYAKTDRYRDDIRLVRLWIRYIDLREDKLEAFNYMNRKGIGESWSLFYEAWAITLEIARQYDDAERVYRTGRERQAKPVERLALREREYYNRMAARRRRDEKKRLEAQKKRLSESQREEARKGRESSRAGSSLANTILSGTGSDARSIHEASVHKVRPALGQISETQAASGRRPFVMERKERRVGSTDHRSSQTSKDGLKPKPQKFEVYSDPDVSANPTIYGMEHNLKKTEDDGQFLPELAKRDDLRKEDQGRLPLKWTGEILPQQNTLRRRLHTGSSLPFEVYQDQEGMSSPTDPIVKAAIKDTGEEPVEHADSLDEIPEGTRVLHKSSTSTNPGSWFRDAVDGSGSPTINTKLAMKEVDDIFNSSHPMDRESESIALRPSAPQSVQRRAEGPGITEASEFVDYGEERENVLGRHLHPGKKPFANENKRSKKRALKTLSTFEGSSVGRVEGAEKGVGTLKRTGSLEESQALTSNRNSSSEQRSSNEYDMTGFLASWCNNDPHFQLLEDPDPEVAKDGMFDLQCRQGLVSFNVDKFRWAGYCGHSYVVLADDLNNSFRLMDTSKDIGSDDDDFKVVAIKVSRSSNAWEYYIYKTIHSRLSTPSNSISQAISFCEGNPKSYLILDSYSSCSLREAQRLLGEKKFPESLSMFFTVSILRVLEDLHGIDMIHSDVTLDNILFRNDLGADISKHPYSASRESGWSRWGVLLVDYNHAVDARHPQLSDLDVISLVQHVTRQGNSFLNEEYRIPNPANWAYNGDCYSASKCAAKMLGIDESNFRSHLNGLQHASAWRNFFFTMQGLPASSTARDTCEAMRNCRIGMEEVLESDRFLAISLMQLVNHIVDANNEDTTAGF